MIRIRVPILCLVPCLAFGVATFARGGSRTDDSTTPLTEESARRHLETIERLLKVNAGGGAAGASFHDFRAAVDALRSKPAVSAPIVLRDFLDASKSPAHRANCAEILREVDVAVPENVHATLDAIVRRETEDPVVRIDAANILLAKGQPSARALSAIRDLASKLLREGTEPGRVYQLIVKHLVARRVPGTEDLLIAEVRRGADPGPALHALGKLRSTRAVSVISSLMMKKAQDRFYPRARGYLALGEIGGARAYDALVSALAREPDRSTRHMIVWALGLTKDGRAKAELLRFIATGTPRDYYVPALRGLEFLGDSSVVPALEAELSKSGQTVYRRERVQAAIDAIREGRDKPDF